MTDAFERPIVLATANPKKVAELRSIFAGIGLGIESLADLSTPTTEPDETGDTFETNATIKALDYARQTGRACLADDSGLEVDALGGAPGVISSHYCTDGNETGMTRDERDLANNQRLLRELDGAPDADRSARFVCVMVLAMPATRAPAVRGGGVSPPTRQTSRQTTAGNLPHWTIEDATYFVTFRLFAGELSHEERRLVADACLFHHPGRATVHIAAVMPDHVHMLVRPRSGEDLASLLHSIKSYTAHEINKARGASGAVWQREYHDRMIRSPQHAAETLEYIQMNPVRAGLAGKPGEYPFTVRGDGRRDAAPPNSVEMSQTVVAATRGTFEGAIGLPGDVPRGTNGFGYDPLFLVKPDLTRTSAELDARAKNRLSHRGEAARSMAEQIAAMRSA